MKSLLIKNVLLNGSFTDVLILGNRFSKIAPGQVFAADETIHCHGNMAILPAFYNAHTHSPMTLLRGYADDLELFSWLKDYIWPLEAKLTARDIRLGTRLAVLEMIKSGTVFFNDMYWNQEETIAVAEEMGVRSAIGLAITNFLPRERIEWSFEFAKSFKPNELTQVTLAPHAVYTVEANLWKRCAETAASCNLKLHTHLAETRSEVADCIAAHGMTPAKWLDSIGALAGNVIAAHCVHLDDADIELLQERGVTLANCPVSNMKLASGIFRAEKCIAADCKIALGTDGCASNNNLDMREEMKVAALLGKITGGEKSVPAEIALKWATRAGAEAFGIDAGVVAEGKLADALLVDLDNECMVPRHNLVSNWVYAADRSCIKTVICNGKILMRDRHVPGEEEIIAEARAWTASV